LVQCADDIVEAISAIDPRSVREPRSDYIAAPAEDALEDDARERVVWLMGMSAVAVDELIRQSALTPSLVQAALLELEIAGRLQRHAGGRVSLA
jgi:DNA processing protein